jgi:AbrB family looped-hinge helix DNA binding protein
MVLADRRPHVPTATMTSKGQITIPKDVRERLGLEPGDRVVFVVHSDQDVALKPAKTDVRELHGMLYRKGRRPRSVEEMDEGIVRSLAERHTRRP